MRRTRTPSLVSHNASTSPAGPAPTIRTSVCGIFSPLPSEPMAEPCERGTEVSLRSPGAAVRAWAPAANHHPRGSGPRPRRKPRADDEVRPMPRYHLAWATPVCGMPGRGIDIALDDLGASRAGSGDWALECGAAIDAMPRRVSEIRSGFGTWVAFLLARRRTFALAGSFHPGTRSGSCGSARRSPIQSMPTMT
jgi:hypothetical protein